MNIIANLTVLKDGMIVKTCPVEDELVLGRLKDCAIRLDDHAISRQHAIFKWEGENLKVEKLSEFGALFLNGAECVSAKLNNTDVITIGPYLIKVSMGAASHSAVSPPTKPLYQSANAASTALEPPQAESFDLGIPSDGAASDLLLDNGSPDSPPASEGEIPIDPAVEGSEGNVEENSIPQVESAESVSSPGDSEIAFYAPEQALPASEAEPSAMISDGAKTRTAPANTIVARLIFEEGKANVTEYVITKDEISIGRGKVCDIVLIDNKASRKNSVIKKVGATFLIQDLNSANGTYVNGVRIQDQELSGNDLIRIGAVEFQFKAESADYADKAIGMARPDASGGALDREVQADESQGSNEQPLVTGQPQVLFEPGFGAPNLLEMHTNTGPSKQFSNNIFGSDGVIEPAGKKKTLYSRFKSLPVRTQALGALVAVLLFMFYNDYDPDPKPKKKVAPAKKAAVTSLKTDAPKGPGVPASFESLPADKKAYIEAQHALGFENYKNKEYDKAIFEISKIFTIIPDYKDSLEIVRYARDGKRRLEAIEEERRKREAEVQLKEKIAHLIEEAKARMLKKDYEQMNEIFTEIQTLDPDNVNVAEWKGEIQAHEDDLKEEARKKEVIVTINRSAWNVYHESMKLKKAGKYHSAISSFRRLEGFGASDEKPERLAKLEIKRCRALINAARDPVLAAAKASETAGEFMKAFDLYKKSTKIDPPYPAGYAGMNRIKGILHDRAKVIYTEAIIAESYSEFANAKKMFKECLDAAPADDLYHERAARKLAHYFEKEEAPPP